MTAPSSSPHHSRVRGDLAQLRAHRARCVTTAILVARHARGTPSPGRSPRRTARAAPRRRVREVADHVRSCPPSTRSAAVRPPSPAYDGRAARQRSGVGVRTSTAAGPVSRSGEAALSHQPAAGDDHDVVDGLLHLAEHVAGDQHGPALGGQRPQEPRSHAMPAGSRPFAGSSRISTGGSPSRACASAEPLPHAEGVAADPAVGELAQRRPGRALVDPVERDTGGERDDLQVVARGPAGVEARPPRARRRPSRSGSLEVAVEPAVDGRGARRRRRPARAGSAAWWSCRRRWGRGSRSPLPAAPRTSGRRGR